MPIHPSRRLAAFASIASIGCLLPGSRLRADHGPGTTGGSVSTLSGETLPEGQVSLGLRWDYTHFESLNSADIERRTARVDDEEGHFDALRWSLLQTFEVSYGVLEDLTLSASLGYYRGEDLREGHKEDTGEIELHDQGDVTGVTDPWFSAKYRFLRGPAGNWAILGGIKLPLGRDDVRGDDGERLEPSLQPGSGAFDFLLATGYSIWLSSQVRLSASAGYVLRTENDDFKVGDRADGGLAIAWRLMEDAVRFPQVTLVGEANVRHLLPNEEDDHRLSNSGGTVLFLSPGITIAFTKVVGLYAAPQFPVLQELRDEQQETLVRGVVAMTFTF